MVYKGAPRLQYATDAGFESCRRRFVKLLVISFIPVCKYLSEERLKGVGSFCLKSMPGKSKEATNDSRWLICIVESMFREG